MTERLYYQDSFLFEFDALVVESVDRQGKHAVILNRTAFYPTSGGQMYDTGTLAFDGRQAAVLEVADEDGGRILHFTSEPISSGTPVHGRIDEHRRRDHVQQHSGQHVLSAAFIELFNFPTVSFHMGDESCTIDLETLSLSSAQVETVERRSNQIIGEDRPVEVRFVPLEQARELGLRKLPPKQIGNLRLIEIKDFDLTACGGTHVRSTGQIGSILLRKVEKMKQAIRVEFVCGMRAVKTARSDFRALSETAGLLSTHIHELPAQVRKILEEARASGKLHQKLLLDLAEIEAQRLLTKAAAGSPRIVTAIFPERNADFIRFLAQKLTVGKGPLIALLASGAGQPTLVFAQTPGQKFDMGQLMREAIFELGGRGGGTANMAQGGTQAASFNSQDIEKLLRKITKQIRA